MRNAMHLAALFLTGALMIAAAAFASPGPPKPPARPTSTDGLTATLIANKDTYALNPAQGTKEFIQTLADLKANGKSAPPTAAIDFTLRLTNTSDKEVKIAVDGDATQIDLKLEGPGAVTVHNNVMMSMIYRIGKPVTIGPGKSYDLPIMSLSFGQRGIAQAAFWTAPGDYTLAATFAFRKDDGTNLEVVSPPVKLKVTK